MFCGKVKEFLSQNRIEYTERNIAADETALTELEKLGYMTTPVTVIDSEIVVGFDRAKLEGFRSTVRACSSWLASPASNARLRSL